MSLPSCPFLHKRGRTPARALHYASKILRSSSSAGMCFVLVMTASASAQQSASVTAAPVLSPFLQRAATAFSPNGAAFKGITLTGTVDLTAGSTKESGTVIFQVGPDGSFGETWIGAADNRSIQNTSLLSGRSCKLSSAKLTQRNLEGVACQRVVPWFAPWLGTTLVPASLTSTTEAVGEVGSTVVSFAPAYGPLSGLPADQQQHTQWVTQAASEDVLFDTATALPSGLHFKEPLNSEAANAIDVSVVYSDYRLEQGFMLPHHIQRYIQRTLESDIQITSVSLN